MKKNLLLIAFAVVLDWIGLFAAQHYGFVIASRWTLFLLPFYGIALGVLLVVAALVVGYVIWTVLAIIKPNAMQR
ncbi:hypothetical protein [Dyella sp.]|uniref:hypothetical protein n=1 Tax=Dyella sp. TaxID=1869338 RepID=UPI0028519890|nr:hypothetical protein [Dyella sp.]MDR3445745.1 hypothetical protein [Dyella sp.]